jgi:predicted house-cleaning noncanonical NTP pyrophosphatase (MazG superfamily)
MVCFMQSQIQKQVLAASHKEQSLAPTENAYHQTLNQRTSAGTWKDIDKYALVPALIMTLISGILYWLLSFALHPALAAALASSILFTLFVVFLYLRNLKLVKHEIYSELNQDLDILLNERPDLVDEIQKLGEYRYRFLTLQTACRESRYNELPDEHKREAEELRKKVKPYLDEEVKEYLAEHNNDAVQIDAILVVLERRIRDAKKPPQLISRKTTNQNSLP